MKKKELHTATNTQGINISNNNNSSSSPLLIEPQRKDKWLRNIKDSWRDVRCVCGSNYHFNGDIDKLFEWENIHLRHFASDYNNHSIISFYPTDMIIYYHSESGYVIERRKHNNHEIKEINQSLMTGNVTMTGV